MTAVSHCIDLLGLEGVDCAAHTVEVSEGVSLRVFEWRPPSVEGSPVVFVAGLITVVDSWVPVLRELAATRRVVYVETREKSSASIDRRLMIPGTFSLVEMGKDIEVVGRELALECDHAVFVGSSLGANAILEALKQGLECKAAFLIGPNAEFFIPWWGHFLIRFPAWAYRAVLPAVLWYLRHFRLDPNREPEQAARYERSLAEAHAGRLKLTLRGLAGYRALEGLDSVGAKIGVAFAGSDALHGEQGTRRLVAALAGGVAIVCASNAAMHSPAIVENLNSFEKDIDET